MHDLEAVESDSLEDCAARLAAAILEDRQPLLLRGAVSLRGVDRCREHFLTTTCAAPPLVPFAGENTVSNERNALGAPTTAAQLLSDDARGQLRVEAPATSEVDALLGAAAREGVDVKRSVAFVTSRGLRTPMHSDAEDGLLLHVAGAKRVVE